MSDDTPDNQTMEELIKELENSGLITFGELARRMRDEEDILWRLNLLLDSGEFCLKAQAAFVLGLLHSRLISPQQKTEYEIAVKELKDATLGKWMGCLELGHRSPTLALDSLFSAEFKNCASLLSQIRNRYAHDATPGRSQLVEITEQLRGAVTGLLDNFMKRALIFVVEPKPQSATSSPQWGRVYLEWDGRKIDLFPWLVAKIERDEPVGIFAFNDFRKNTPSFVDHGRGGGLATFSPVADAWIVQSLRQMFDVDGPAMTFDEMIAIRSDLRDPSSVYITRTQSVSSIRQVVFDNRGRIVWLRGEAGSGKTGLVSQLIVALEQDPAWETSPVVLRHFCSKRASGTSSASAIKKNLCSQLRAQLPVGEPSSELGDTVTCYLAAGGKDLWVLIDGLDEMNNAAEMEMILREMAKLAKQHPGRSPCLLIAGQPHLETLFQRAGDDFVPLSAGGMSAEEISLVAQKYEAWNRGWTDADNHQLATKTGGLPLYVQSFLKELTEGRKTREDIESLPTDMNDYWSTILDSALSSLS